MKFIAALTREIFFPLEDKIHMFAPSCNILRFLDRPRYFIKIYKKSFSRVGDKMWNELPNSLRKLVKQVFKTIYR